MLKFIKSASGKDSWLETEKEVCFIGRSNVGKSSLINALADNEKVAITSKTPGRTMLVNYFQDPKTGNILVDLPGYGYAKADIKKMRLISKMIGEYLLENPSIIRVYILVDGQVGPTPLDVDMLHYLMMNNLQITIIVTKTDKTTQAEMHKTRKKIDDFGLEAIYVSAKKNRNIKQLKEHINAQFSKS